jgi:hypothetical protein
MILRMSLADTGFAIIPTFNTCCFSFNLLRMLLQATFVPI